MIASASLERWTEIDGFTIRLRTQRASGEPYLSHPLEVAHLLVDGELALSSAGGELEYYGLTGLRYQHSACDQLPFLEGLLPLPETPFLIRSMGMPSRSRQ